MATHDDLDLSITRAIRAPRALVWKAWSDPEHLKHWWCPKPWTTEVLAFDFRPGGGFHTFMRGPDGDTSDNPGSFLEIVPQTRIVMTSCLVGDWRPAPDVWLPFSAVISLADEGKGTRYTATCLHKDRAGRDQHEQLGFYEGWGICITQLDEYALSLR